MDSQINTEKRLIVAGGGTGGHLFPGISIVEKFQDYIPNNKVFFVSRGNDFEVRTLSHLGYPFKKITIEGFRNRSFFEKLRSLVKIPMSILQSIHIVREFQPHIVLGVGSYAAGPVLFAAWLLKVPIALHEQNTEAGMTNQIAAHFARAIYTSFEHTDFKKDWSSKIVYTGNPIRKSLEELCLKKKNYISDETVKEKNTHLFTILIFGGSQGANKINLAMIDALNYLEEKEKYHFIHQTGDADIEKVRAAYSSHNVKNHVQTFFNDMAKVYKDADLIICRAGATTIAEITALGKAVLFVPFPFAAGNHQEKNAKYLADQGAADLILEKDLSGVIFAQKINHWLKKRHDLESMAERIGQFGKINAAEVIVDDFCNRFLNFN